MRGDSHYLGWPREFIIYIINSLSNCTVRYVYFQGSRGEGRWTDKRVYNLQNKQLIKLCSQVCVLPGGVGVRGDGHYLGWPREFTIYRTNSLSNCTVRYVYFQGSRGEGRWTDKRVYNLQNKQLIKLCSQVCVLPGGVGVRGDGHYLGWPREFTIYRIISLSNCVVRYVYM